MQRHPLPVSAAAAASVLLTQLTAEEVQATMAWFRGHLCSVQRGLTCGHAQDLRPSAAAVCARSPGATAPGWQPGRRARWCFDLGPGRWQTAVPCPAPAPAACTCQGRIKLLYRTLLPPAGATSSMRCEGTMQQPVLHFWSCCLCCVHARPAAKQVEALAPWQKGRAQTHRPKSECACLFVSSSCVTWELSLPTSASRRRMAAAVRLCR